MAQEFTFWVRLNDSIDKETFFDDFDFGPVMIVESGYDEGVVKIFVTANTAEEVSQHEIAECLEDYIGSDGSLVSTPK